MIRSQEIKRLRNMKNDIIVLHARDVKKALPKAPHRRFAWLYLGQDITQMQHISQVLGKENRYLISDLLQQVALQEKQPFLDFIAELGLHQKNRCHWWASNTAYKNPITDDLFLLWCYAAVFEKACLKGEQNREKSLVVFVQDRWLYKYLWQCYRQEGLSFPSRKFVLLEALKSIGKGIAIRGYLLLKAGYYIWHSRNIGSGSPTPDSTGGEREIYLYSWIEERFFKENGRFEDAYLGRLKDLVKNSGMNVTYITPPFLSPHLKKKCLNHGGCKFIFLDHYINFQSILRSSFSFFWISLPRNLGSRFPSIRILLKREAIHELPAFSSNILYYFAFKKWLKGVKQKKMTIIYPFENQPWDKMLRIAAKESDKDVQLIGYQHSVVPLLLLNYFLGAGESSIMPLVDCVVTNSEYTLDLLKDAGYGETKLVNGGALRYEYLYKTDKNPIKKDETFKSVLVALPALRTVVEELLTALFDAFKDSPNSGFRLVVKFHPDLPLEKLRIRLLPWPVNIQKTDKPIAETLPEVDLVIYSSSTSGLEALMAGVPVIRYCSEHTLDLDPLGYSGEVGIESCSASNIKEVVLSALHSRSSDMNRESTSSSLRKLFSPVDEDVWHQILKL